MAILTRKKPVGKLETIGFLVSAQTLEPVAEIVSRKKTRKAKHTTATERKHMNHCVCRDTGPFRSDVKGVLIGTLGAALKIERCDICKVYASDEDAAQAYVKKHGGRWMTGTFWFPGGADG